MECKKKEQLTAHHIDEVKYNCSPSNLITLCRGCNTAASRRQDKEILRKKYICISLAREAKISIKFIPSWVIDEDTLIIWERIEQNEFFWSILFKDFYTKLWGR